ncbi:PTS transporter subunit EIIC [Entomospira culicis]|uniref:PTS transporter subunit EIIC n=1 Tax=Entomospira culicis TaxID=2719989 RepID=A0A968GHU6_9SPIO|nr:PTS transporter subunit EIIC [Entomospira culicis]NIZ18695.1 PTS transporter subunit EIIC [Entomospira culicis]NIZ68910.1 PTS transporter subunit EIIC [Entomospira culicis]WDI37503.1 PTS transporter subunit EIIC [Entomospira culicis]WDI39131.1 PTS transporter subunit EIIC [Entomospira culicis]
MDAKKIASDLLTQIKPEYILGLQHCATRLRFRLKESAQVDDKAVEAIEGVLSVVRSGGQYQVIIGPGVIDVFRYLNDVLKISDATPRLNKGQAGTKIQDVIFNYISGSLQPLLPAMAGAGIIKGLLALLVVILAKTSPNYAFTTSGTYQLLDAISDSAFYFLPIFLGFSAAKTLGSNPYIGALLGAILLHPIIGNMATNFMATNTLERFLGLPFIPMNYANSVLPILVSVAILAPFERFLQRVLPKSLTIILVSLTILLVLVPVVVMLFGPAMYFLSIGLVNLIEYFLNIAPWLVGAILGGTWFLLVTLGLHWALIPITYIQYAEYGSSSLLALFWVSTMAQIGVTIAVLIRNKDQNFQTLIRPATGVAILAGITEPIVYGVVLKYKRLIPIVALSGAISGALTAILKVSSTPAGLGGILSWPGFLGAPSNSFTIAILAMIIQVATAILAMILALAWGHEEKVK